MAGKEIVVKFKVDGIDYTASSTDSLNTKVEQLNTTFEQTLVSANKAFKSATDSSKGFNVFLSYNTDELRKMVAQSGELNKSVGTVGESGRVFGEKLERSAKGASQAIGAIASGLQFVGLQNESIAKVSAGLRVVAELLKAQEFLNASAFGSKSIGGALKSMAQYVGIMKTTTVATEGAAVATRGFGAAFKSALGPIGLILIAIELIITAYEAFSKKAEEDRIKKSIEENVASIEAYNEELRKGIEYLTKLDLVKNNANIDRANLELQIMKSMNATIDEQYKAQVQLIALKQKGLELSLDQEKQNQKSLENERNGLEEEKRKLGGIDYEKSNEIQEKINKANDQINDSIIKQNELSEKLNVSHELDLKVLKAQTNELRAQETLRIKNAVRALTDTTRGINKNITDSQSEVSIDAQKEKIDELKSVIADIERKGKSSFQERMHLIVQSYSLDLAIFSHNEKEKLRVLKQNLQQQIDDNNAKLKAGTTTGVVGTGNKLNKTEIDAIKKQNDELNNYILQADKETQEKITNARIKNARDRSEEEQDLIKKDNQRIIKEIVDAYTQISNSVMDVFSAINDAENIRAQIKEDRLQKELDDFKTMEDEKQKIIEDATSHINDMDKQLSNAKGSRHSYLLKLIASEQHKLQEAEKQKQIAFDEQKKRDEEIKQIQHDAAVRNLKLQKAEVITAGIVAEAQVFASFAGLPFGTGLVAGYIAAGTIAAATIIRVKSIDEQIEALEQKKYGGLLNKKDTGGLVNGESHQNGGVRGTGAFNNVEVEGGEFINNKESTNNNLDILRTINNNPNKRFKIVPSISRQSAVASDGGLLMNFDKVQPLFGQNTDVKDAIIQGMREANISVAVTEINRVNESVAKIKQFATV